MRIAVCLLLAALNALLAAAFTTIAFDTETLGPVKLAFGVAALAMAAASGLLTANPFIKLPSAAVAAFRVWCFALPALYFVASLDSGMISGQEFLLGVFVAGFSWVTWRAFNWARRQSSPAAQAGA
jgi:hypothetical protein